MTLFEEHKQYAQKVIAVRDALVRSLHYPESFKTLRFQNDGDVKTRTKIRYGHVEIMSIHIGPKLMGKNISRGVIGRNVITFNHGVYIVYNQFISYNEDVEIYMDALYDEDIYFQHLLLYSEEELRAHVIYNMMHFMPICEPYLHCEINVSPTWINSLYEDINFVII